MRERSIPQRTIRLPAAVMLVAGCLLITAIAWKGGQPPSSALAHPPTDRPECPHDSAYWTDTLGTTHGYAQIPLSGEITVIPEFHDCQRFIRSDGSYDSLYAIYAAFHLESLPCGLSCGAGQASAVAVPAATVLSYGGRYPHLGIKTGFNCLYLWDPPSWKAAMIWQYDNPDCRSRPSVTALPANAMLLPVHAIQPQSVPPFREREYPPVARWDWDPKAQEQYIGVRCGLAWCEVGGPSVPDIPGTGPMYPPLLPFDPVAGFIASSATTRAVSRVKGWGDAQPLAFKAASPAAGALKVQPSRLIGFVVPNPVLGDLQRAQFESTWVHVAWAVVGADYPSKLSYRRGRNKIFLCYGSARGCRIQVIPKECASSSTAPGWWAITRLANDSLRYNCVTWRPYPGGIDVPGTVRWRWQAEDETNWIKCPSGCCEVRP